MGSLVCVCVSVGVKWPSSSTHSEHVLCLLTGPRETGGCVTCSPDSVRSSLTVHSSGGGQCPGEELHTSLYRVSLPDVCMCLGAGALWQWA